MPPWNAPLWPAVRAEMSKVEQLPSSLCFRQAWVARSLQRIDHREYYRHIFAHLTGTRHQEDESHTGSGTFTKSVLDCARQMGRLEDATAFEQIFLAYEAGDLDAVKAGVDKMPSEHVPYLLRMLASRALEDASPRVLEFCFAKEGFEYTYDSVNEADWLAEVDDPETSKVLERSTLRKAHPRSDRHPAAEFRCGREMARELVAS